MPTSTRERSRVTQETTYGIVASAGHKLAEPSNTFLATVDCVQQWISEGYAFELPQEAQRRETFTIDEGGHRVETVSMLEDGLWSVRWSHPDLGLGAEIPPVPGRHLTVDASVTSKNQRTSVALRITCATPAGHDAPINYIRPKVIRALADRIGLEQEIPLSEEPWILRSKEDLDALENFLASKDRRMPVFLISEIDRRKWDFTPHPPKFMIDSQYLARKALGYAHVVLLPYTLGFQWTERVGTSWAAFDGSVRLYMPGLDFAEDTIGRHPVMYKRQIQEFPYGDKKGPSAFACFLADRLASHGARRPVRWDDAVFVPEARVRLADHRARHIARLTDVTELRTRYEAQISALRQQVTEAEEDAEQWSDASVQAAKDLDYYTQENKALRRQLEVLRASLEAKTGKPADAEVPIPDSYERMPEWVDTHFAGRLVLHPRAVRALKSATYEDVALVYKALLLLANDYRNMRVGLADAASFETATQKLNLDCSGSIDKMRAGEEGDTYFVSYPIGSSSKEFLAMHLRKGSKKDDRYCLAIYFFWDEDTRQVVVGWLPSHLQNRLT